jgi:DNA adenine methylase
MTMTLSAFPYPGGKTLLTDWIVEQIPDHHVYVEPFGGSAAVLLNKPRSSVEVYNDIDGDIVQFFDVARDRPDELIEWSRRTPYSEELYNRWVADYYNGNRPDDPVERAGRWLFLRFTQFGGKYDHTAGFKRDQPRKKKGSSHLWRTLEERVDAISERLQGVSIQNGDYQDIIEKYDSENTVFYCDPPYLSKEHTYRVRDFDHGELADALSGIDGYAMVSYTDVPDGYTSWTELTRTHNHESDQDPKRVTERLFLNFAPERTARFAGANQTRLTEVQ